MGFAWQVPFFGEGKTTVRGGYQITYQGTVQVNTLDSAIGNAPGTTNQQQFAGDGSNPYLDLARVLSNYAPVPVTVQPMQPIPIGATGVSFNAYDPNYVSPYVQNFTMSVTRNVMRNMTLDVRYVGNIAVKQNKSINLNTNNFLYNGLKEQFDSIRAGGEAPMLDQMLGGINITGAGPIGTVAGGTAASQLRASTTFNTNLANGNYNGVAGSLATFSYTTANNPTLPVIPNGQTVGDALRNSGLFPSNFIQANPQFSSATYNTNLGHTNYNSMEAQPRTGRFRVSPGRERIPGARISGRRGHSPIRLTAVWMGINCSAAIPSTNSEAMVQLNCRSDRTSFCLETARELSRGPSNIGRPTSFLTSPPASRQRFRAPRRCMPMAARISSVPFRMI